jgi:AcrR family transcriptional regulator
MPPKTVYSREDVIKAGYALLAAQGLQGVSARAVARQLGCSTAPVYSHFTSMDELVRAVLVRAKDQLHRYSTEPYTEGIFLNIGVGIVCFARDHAPLFRALFLESDAYRDIIEQFRSDMLQQMRKDERLRSLSLFQCETLLTHMSIFTHGLAAMICVGLMERTDQQSIIAILREVGGAVVGAVLDEAGRRQGKAEGQQGAGTELH